MTATTNLSEKAMLVNITISAWTGRKKNKRVTNEVLYANDADGDAGGWWTSLLPKSALAEINTTAGRCRTEFCVWTLPWKDGGTRVLSVKLYSKFSKAMRKVMDDFKQAVRDFLDRYPTIIADARNRLGKLADDQRIPTVDEIARKFDITLDIDPLPCSGDFRLNMADVDVDQIKLDHEQNIGKKVEKAVGDLWNQFGTLLQKIEQTMNDPKKIFRDSLITNLKDFVELMPQLNLLDNPQINELQKEAYEKLSKLDPEDLRAIKRQRKQAGNDAADLLKKIKQYV